MLKDHTPQELFQLIQIEFYNVTKRPHTAVPSQIVINETDYDIINKYNKELISVDSDIKKLHGMKVIRTYDIDRGQVVIS
jgi:hypothetical protein